VTVVALAPAPESPSARSRPSGSPRTGRGQRRAKGRQSSPSMSPR
jgi:hypothetical protein